MRLVKRVQPETERLFPILVGFLVLACACVLSPGNDSQILGVSMEPNYPDGTIMRIIEIEPHELTRGDLVYFEGPFNPSIFFIKRLIGLPGETIEIVDGHIYVDRESLEEPYLTIAATYSGSWKLGKDEYFVLGDNRPNSSDSQNWGALSGEHIIGLAIPIGQ